MVEYEEQRVDALMQPTSGVPVVGGHVYLTLEAPSNTVILSYTSTLLKGYGGALGL